jgi:hypothetical protein
LLFINGGIIIVGIIVTIVQDKLSSEEIGGMGRTVRFTVLLGLLFIGLGIWKIISDRKVLSKQQPS